MRTILVKLPNWMGDILFSYDLLYSLSHHFERTIILTSEHHAELFHLFPLENAEVIAYPSVRWPVLNQETVRKIREASPDFGLLLPNSFGSALVLRLAGVSKLAGYDTEHRGPLLAKRMAPPKWRVHQFEYYLNLARLFNIPALTYAPTAPQVSGSRRIIIHPGASKPERGWHFDRFVTLAKKLSGDGFEVLFVSVESLPETGFEKMIAPSLSQFVGALKDSTVFVGNDSGPLHLAQQCGLPVVGIYGPGDPARTGPRNISPSRVISHYFPCSPCRQRYFEECEPSSNYKPFCIETITVEEVYRAVLDLSSDKKAEQVLYR